MVAVIALSSVPQELYAATGTINPASKYSQFYDIDLDSSGDKDLINWAPTNGIAVQVTDTAITGTIWGETVGWINLNPSSAGPTAGVKNNCSGVLSGYAWGQNTGWINFNPTNATVHPNIDTTTGNITGQVWSQNYGYIQLASTQTGFTGLNTTWHGCSSGTPSGPTGPTGPTGPPPIDVCLNIPDLQMSIPYGYYGTADANCYPIGQDLCPNLTGVQATVPNGYHLDSIGNCVLASQDFCPNIVGVQASIPSGYAIDNNGNCVVAQNDICPNLSGVQSSVPSGYYINANGNCVTNSQDLCPNISGVQSTVPSGYQINSSGNCVLPPSDVCPNLPGDQASVPSGYQTDSLGNCVQPDQDFCPNISGVQATIPSGYQVDGSGNCLPPSQICTAPGALNVGAPLPCQFDDTDPTGSTSATGTDNTSGPSATTSGPGSWFGTGFTIPGLGNIPPAIPVAIGAVGLLSTIPGLLARFGSMLLTVVLYRRKRPWGVVFDSQTKEPLDPAYVSVVDTVSGKEVFNQITDIDGRFGFFLKQGTYQIIVNKTNYLFPSKLLAGQMRDSVYENLYFGETFSVTGEEKVITLNVPMDRLATDWNQDEKRRKNLLHYFTRNHALWDAIFNIVFVAGFIASVVITFISPVWWNILMVALYVIIVIMQSFGFGPVKTGVVTKDGLPLEHAIVRVYSAGANHEIAHRVTDEEGRYYVLVPRSDLYVTIEAKNADGTYTKVYTSQVFHAGKGVISDSFNL